jgi:hypothetical protein
MRRKGQCLIEVTAVLEAEHGAPSVILVSCRREPRLGWH